MNSPGTHGSKALKYARYRWDYAPRAVRTVIETAKITADSVVADIGSGTGLLSKLFLDFGNRVLGVEPNAEMRAAGEEFLSRYPNFTSIAGSAEATTLPSDSVDFVAAGQAFHWFQMPAARNEFHRILKSEGRVLIIWNERLLDETAFLREYEALLLRFGTDYARVNESYPRAEQMLEFFGATDFTSHSLPNFQEFDFDGLSGRLRSSSYAPPPGHPQFEPMMKELRQLYDAHQRRGVVRMEYRTRVYAGKLDHDRTSA
jgi:SAM-dependent methyltransferase